MKNLFIFLLAFIFISSGCSSIESTALMEDRTKIQGPRPKGIIPTGHKCNELAMQIGKYSWADLDRYYRNILPREKKEDYYDNVRKTMISSMVQAYGLAEKGDDKSIVFYLNEVQELKLMQPDVTLKLLIRAEKSMAPNEVKNIALKIYDFNQKAIAGLDNPKSYLVDMWQKWEDIRLFAER